jgi:hypothetical protein
MTIRDTMALTDTDRRRFLLATTLTLLALPALWWANQSENSTAPNVAVAGADVGVDVGADHEVGAASKTASNADHARLDTDSETVGDIAPVFLDGPSAATGAGLSEIAVPARPDVARINADATFRSDIGGPNSCAVPGIINDQQVTVVNLDNARSVTCTTTLALGSVGDLVTLHSSLFAQLADMTDAQIPVEIRR